ncbi:hypothetical protein [Chroococcidiopsis sp.]|uniref:hypothetical protein n=1 Tax=Chroococcidiopsis sp. TaxID=3088168 RepID=UPI003F312B19
MNKLYFFKSKSTGQKRTTGVIASSARAARAKVTRPKDPVVYAVRSLTATEKKQASKGKWVRGRIDRKVGNKSKVKGRGFYGKRG